MNTVCDRATPAVTLVDPRSFGWRIISPWLTDMQKAHLSRAAREHTVIKLVQQPIKRYDD